MVIFDYKKNGGYNKLTCLATKCVNFKEMVYWKMDNRNNKDNIIVFIKDVVFQNFYFLVNSEKRKEWIWFQERI